MSGRPDGRIEKGQRIGSAISARAWNRAQDAADIVLGVRPGIEAGPLTTLRLPCVRATLPDKGFFGEVRMFLPTHSGTPVEAVMPTGPYVGLGNESLLAETPLNKQSVAYSLPETMRSSTSEYNRFNMESRFAICIGNDSTDYALSGLAITRVRVWKKEHRYARLPRPVEGYTGPEPNGCLDSSWWGPARIIGYAHDHNDAGSLEFFHSATMSDSTVVFRWALVHF